MADIAQISLSASSFPSKVVLEAEGQPPACAQEKLVELSDVMRAQSMQEVLCQQLKEVHKQLLAANVQIGYLQGMLQEKDEQLKLIPELRLQAAKGIAYKADLAKLQKQYVELEAENTKLKKHVCIQAAKAFKTLFSS